MSHGEAFLTVLDTMFTQPGLYVMDEPEAALSFTSCLRLLALMGRLAETGAQVVCATHSPLLHGTGRPRLSRSRLAGSSDCGLLAPLSRRSTLLPAPSDSAGLKTCRIRQPSTTVAVASFALCTGRRATGLTSMGSVRSRTDGGTVRSARESGLATGHCGCESSPNRMPGSRAHGGMATPMPTHFTTSLAPACSGWSSGVGPMISPCAPNL